MLHFPPSVRIYLCTTPTDMRKSFDGLAAIVQQQMGEDPLSGHLFLFRNRRRDRIKALYFDDDGLALWYKRLERGTFQFPTDVAAGSKAQGTSGGQAAGWEIRAQDLSLILSGIELRSVRRRRRWSKPNGLPGGASSGGASSHNESFSKE